MLLERALLLDALHERATEARQGAGSLVLVGGEAGAGKTALVSAFVDALDRSTDVLQGACDPLLTPRPLSPVRDFATDPASGLSDIDVDGTENLDLFRVVLERLGSRDRLMVVVIEDLHWADQSTLDLLRFLGRRLRKTTTVLVGTFRDDEVGSDHPLRPVLGQLATLESTFRMVVPPLSGDAVAVLADDSELDAARLHELTGGNAFFVTEALAVGELLPPTIQDAVLARVARLDVGMREVVRAVAIAPRFLEVSSAAALVGDEAADIDAAVDAGVIVADDRTLRFRHELARSAVEQAIPPAARQRLHRRMLEHLLDEPAPDHARLAHHAIRADSPALIVEFAPKAAQDAAKRGALRELVTLLRATLEHRAYLEPEREGELLLELATHLDDVDDRDAAVRTAEEAAGIFERIALPERQAVAVQCASRALGRIGHADEALAGAQRAVAMLEPFGDSEALASALAGVAAEFMLSRRASEGMPYARRALEMSTQLGLEEPRFAAQHAIACLELVGGDPDRGIELLEESVDAARGHWRQYSIAVTNLGSGAGEMRRYEVARDALLRAEAHGVDHDIDATVDYVRAWLARIAFEQGNWPEAVRYAEIVDRVAVHRSGYALLTADGALGRVRVRRGDPGGAERLTDGLGRGEGHRLQHTWQLTAGLAEHHWLASDLGRMAETLDESFRAALAIESRWARGELGFWMWKAGRLAEAPDGAAEPYALQIGGNWRDAADVWRDLGCPYEEALALADGGTDAQLEALAIFDGLGAKPMADRVRSQLRTAGVEGVPRGPNVATQANPWSLTARQVEVLRLIGDGLSNGDIAERLYVSKKTVEHHVSAIYLKLGVETRQQAMLAARELAASAAPQT